MLEEISFLDCNKNGTFKNGGDGNYCISKPNWRNCQEHFKSFLITLELMTHTNKVREKLLFLQTS